MIVRIRLGKRRQPDLAARTSGQTALVLSSLLAPASLMAWALAAWCLLANMNQAGEFAFRSGLLSHWQVWIAVGIAVQFAAFLIGRAGRPDSHSTQEPGTPDR